MIILDHFQLQLRKGINRNNFTTIYAYFTRKNGKLYKYSNIFLFNQIFRGYTLKSPYANGKELNLYDIYEAVTSLGGWQKVTSFDRWNEG
jgi:hypothetical protein